MKLDKAIEINTIYKETGEYCDSEDLAKAQQLGIEALKREIFFRQPHFKNHIKLLPGETPPDTPT